MELSTEEVAMVTSMSSMTSKSQRHPQSLVHAALVSYLKFLELECASYVMLTNLNSALWNPVKEKLFHGLKNHLKSTFKGDPHQSGLVRTVLINQVLSGRYPSSKLKNNYVCNDHRFSANNDDNEDYDAVTKLLEAVKLHGRKCSSTCCTGAFVAETMLAILVNEDVSHLIFDSHLCDRFYKDKPIRPFLFFDITSVLVHYIISLDEMDDEGDGFKTPALSKLIINSPNLGSLTSQSVYGRLLQVYSETRHYQEYPWKLSQKLSRPTSQFMMLTLSNLFDRPANYFTNLTVLKLSGECINTRLNVIGGRGGHAVTHLMASLAHSCPVLEIIDFSDVTSLYPEAIVYLCYQDAYQVLHKYMYLPKYCTDDEGNVFHDLDSLENEAKKHNGISYCPWCYDPMLKHKVRKGCAYDVNSSIYVLDDRLYDYIKTPNLLVYCVKISQLLKAFADPIYELQRDDLAEFDDVVEEENDEGEVDQKFRPPKFPKYKLRTIDEVESKSPLCYTIKELRLPNDNTDSKAWILPLLLDSMPNLISLGETSIYDGLKVMKDLKSVPWPKKPLKLEEANLKLEDATLLKTMSKQQSRLTSLTSWFPKWSQFCETKDSSTIDQFNNLENFVQSNLSHELIRPQDIDSLYQTWKEQISVIVKTCPYLKKIKLTIKSGILYSDSTEIWEPFLNLKYLEELQIHCSCKSSIMSLLKVIGSKLKVLKLYFSPIHNLSEENPISSLINVVPHFCPKLQKVFFGYLQTNVPHGITREEKYGTVFKESDDYIDLIEFEVAGQMDLMAFMYLWQRATKLHTLRISGNIVICSAEDSTLFNEQTFSLERIRSFFHDNPMSNLRKFDIPITLQSIEAASKLLALLPHTMEYIAMLTIMVSIADSTAGVPIGDAIASVLREMVDFKLSCKKREVELQCQIKWAWKHEGILNILLQQSVMASVTEFIHP